MQPPGGPRNLPKAVSSSLRGPLEAHAALHGLESMPANSRVQRATGRRKRQVKLLQRSLMVLNPSETMREKARYSKMSHFGEGWPLAVCAGVSGDGAYQSVREQTPPAASAWKRPTPHPLLRPSFRSARLRERGLAGTLRTDAAAGARVRDCRGSVLSDVAARLLIMISSSISSINPHPGLINPFY